MLDNHERWLDRLNPWTKDEEQQEGTDVQQVETRVCFAEAEFEEVTIKVLRCGDHAGERYYVVKCAWQFDGSTTTDIEHSFDDAMRNLMGVARWAELEA